MEGPFKGSDAGQAWPSLTSYSTIRWTRIGAVIVVAIGLIGLFGCFAMLINNIFHIESGEEPPSQLGDIALAAVVGVAGITGGVLLERFARRKLAALPPNPTRGLEGEVIIALSALLVVRSSAWSWWYQDGLSSPATWYQDGLSSPATFNAWNGPAAIATAGVVVIAGAVGLACLVVWVRTAASHRRPAGEARVLLAVVLLAVAGTAAGLLVLLTVWEPGAGLAEAEGILWVRFGAVCLLFGGFWEAMRWGLAAVPSPDGRDPGQLLFESPALTIAAVSIVILVSATIVGTWNADYVPIGFTERTNGWSAPGAGWVTTAVLLAGAVVAVWVFLAVVAARSGRPLDPRTRIKCAVACIGAAIVALMLVNQSVDTGSRGNSVYFAWIALLGLMTAGLWELVQVSVKWPRRTGRADRTQAAGRRPTNSG